MRHEWNTGRAYGERGQLMVAKVEDEAILFSDRSRNISGVIPLGANLQRHRLDAYTIENLVMTNYDFGNYSNSPLTLYMRGESK